MLMNVWVEVERRKRLEAERERKFFERLRKPEEKKEPKLTQEEKWLFWNTDFRLQNPISPLLPSYAEPRMKLKPRNFGLGTCKYSFCKDKSDKKKTNHPKYLPKRDFGNHMCPICCKLILPTVKRVAYHYNHWYNHIQSKTIFFWFAIKRARIWRISQDEVNYEAWFFCVEPFFGFWRCRHLLLWWFAWLISLVFKDKQWKFIKGEMCVRGMKRHFYIIFSYVQLRFERFITLKWISNYFYD